MLQESVDTIDLKCLDSFSECKNGFTPAFGVGIINDILTTFNPCNPSSSQSPRDEQNVTEMIKCFNNRAHLLWNTNIFKWWEKQAVSDLKLVAKVALALPVT